MKIKYKLWVEGCAVKFQILEQVELKHFYYYECETGWQVKSQSFPFVNPEYQYLFLRGDKEELHLQEVVTEAESPAEAHKLAAVIHETLEDWAKSLDDAPDEVNAVNVFVL